MVICSAIQYLIKSTGEVATICGMRHGDCIETMKHLGIRKPVDCMEIEQGFVTTKGFMPRVEAYQHALSCGQISATVEHFKNERNENELYSEDLW